MIQNVFRLAISSTALALLAFAVITAPAFAHQSIVSQGDDFAITATNRQSGLSATWNATDISSLPAGMTRRDSPSKMRRMAATPDAMRPAFAVLPIPSLSAN